MTDGRARALILAAAHNGQRDQIVRLHLAGLADTGSLSLDPTLDADLIDIESSYAAGAFVVAFYADDPTKIVGMGALRQIEDEWHVKRMRVDASHRGRGIGQAVLDHLIDQARSLNISTLVLDTSLQQTAAQRLYERKGFVHTGDAVIGGVASRLYRLTLA